MHLLSNQKFDLVVIGGGAAGFMSAITASEKGVSSVLLLEGNPKPLEKVRISGGGRCNVTNACWDPKDLAVNYPRGKSSLLHIFRRFASGDAVSWFADRGVNLIVENDGRMFPSSNSSSEIISCLQNAAKSSGVHLHTGLQVKKIQYLDHKHFVINCRDGSVFESSMVLIATGSSPSGRKIAADLGHEIISPVPSLFSFQLDSEQITSCSGLSLDNIDLKLITVKNTFSQRGKILITHWGLSGPLILRMSAFAARELAYAKYQAKLMVNWINMDSLAVDYLFKECRHNNGNKTLNSFKPFSQIPRRLWNVLLNQARVDPLTKWGELKSLDQKRLIQILISSVYFVKGRGPYRDEFVTAGGVNLQEVDFSTMESKKLKGLFFAGEVLDIDGLTGGFNFQHCWTSGWIAGLAIAKKFFNC